MEEHSIKQDSSQTGDMKLYMFAFWLFLEHKSNYAFVNFSRKM
uniref:Uncharacterized protein n=1 Tax=Arundo donax TaxID=35708 RepID=A0A0A8XZ44_ARUDO